MPLLTATQYQAITGDTATPTLAQLTAGQSRVETFLGRPVEADERTERCRIYPDGAVYPLATPVTAAEGWTIDGPALLSTDILGFRSPWQSPGFSLVERIGSSRYVDVTYTGGWTTDDVPQPIVDALAWETYRYVHPELAPNPVTGSDPASGATSLTNGDVSVSYGNGRPGDPSSDGSGVMNWTANLLGPWRRRDVTASPV